MRILIQNYKTGELSLESIPTPTVGAGTARVEVAASVISAGTERMVVDLAKKSYLGKARSRPDLLRQVIDKVRQEGLASTIEKVRAKLETPVPLGYSCAGTIVEAAPGFPHGVGTRVACGGAGVASHAEFNIVPKNLMAPISDAVSFDAAAYVTVGSIALQGVRQADVRLGERIGVIGLGLIGQLTVQILKASGCDVLGSDLDAWKLDRGTDSGADRVCTPEEFAAAANEFTNGVGLDAVIVTASTSSSAPIESAGEAARQRGRVVSVGLTGLAIPRDLYYYKELELRMSQAYGPGRHDPAYEQDGIDYPIAYVRWTEQRNFGAFLRLVEQGAVDPRKLTTHTYDFDKALDAYELITAKEPQNYLGIVLRYDGADRDTARVEAGPRQDSAAAESQSMGMRSGTGHGVVGIGAIGAGGFAKSVLYPYLKKRKDVDLLTVVTRGGLSAVDAAKRFGFKRASTDVDEMLGNPAISAVIIATPHASHAELIQRSVEAGKHVFVEKPLAISTEQLDQLAAVGREGPVIQVGFNRRFSPFAARARTAIGGRTCTLVYRVNAGPIPKEHWIHDPAVGGGRVIGEVCHFLDFCSYVTDSVPRTVIATKSGHTTTHDDLTITLTYENGSVATIVYSALGNPRLPKERIEGFGHELAFTIDNFRRMELLAGKRRETFRVRGRGGKGFAEEIDAFMASVATGTPAIPLEDAITTTRTTLAALRSLEAAAPVGIGS